MVHHVLITVTKLSVETWTLQWFFGYVEEGEGPPALSYWQLRKLLELKRFAVNMELYKLYKCFMLIFWWLNGDTKLHPGAIWQRRRRNEYHIE